MSFLSKVRQLPGKKKGVKRFHLPNFLSFTVARTPMNRGDLMIMKRRTFHSNTCYLVVYQIKGIFYKYPYDEPPLQIQLFHFQ